MYTLPLSKPLYVSLSMPYRGEECRDSVEGEEHEYRILKNSMMASSYPSKKDHVQHWMTKRTRSTSTNTLIVSLS